MTAIDKELINRPFADAAANVRLRANYDLRNSPLGGSQRALNALMSATKVPIHHHTKSSKSVVLICGSMDGIFYDNIR